MITDLFPANIVLINTLITKLINTYKIVTREELIANMVVAIKY